MKDHIVSGVATIGWQLVILPEPFVDILHIDDGIVDKRANSNTHTTQSHSVDFIAQKIKA